MGEDEIDEVDICKMPVRSLVSQTCRSGVMLPWCGIVMTI